MGSDAAAEKGNHAARKHALCSASSAERWLECPGSVGLGMQLPEPEASIYALEGTRAHELSEVVLHHWQGNGYKITDEFLEGVKAKSIEAEGSQDMFDYIMTYVNLCIDEVESFDQPPTVRIEQRLVFSEDMQMFGTADFLVTGIKEGISTGVIVDLKYGKGKRVKTQDNPQLAYYACALKRCSKKKLERIKVRVVQPRINEFYSEQWYSLDDLAHWEMKLTLGAESALMMAGKAKTPTYRDGGWCWFCPGKTICPRIKEKLEEKIIEQFPDDLPTDF